MSTEAHEPASPTWGALQKVGEQCLRPQQTPAGEGEETHRQRIAEAICDGYSNGNQPFSEAPLTVQHSCRMAAEAVMALSRPVAEKPAALAHPQQGGERERTAHARAWVAAEYRVAGSPHEHTASDSLAMARYILSGQPPSGRALKSCPEEVKEELCSFPSCNCANARLPSVPVYGEAWQMVPTKPTEKMWSGLARQIVMWTRESRPTGSNLHRHLRNTGSAIPKWLASEIEDADYVPPKGAVAIAIYRAMIDAAPTSPSKSSREEA